MKHNIIKKTNVYYTDKDFQRYEEEINYFIDRFKAYYSKFDKRIMNTRKSVVVSIKLPYIHISLDYNNVHYGQVYSIKTDFVKVY